MITTTDLAERVDPKRTALFLGAGSSVASGGPTAITLARKINNLAASGAIAGDDLMEVAGIAELKFGRPAVVQAVRDALKPLRPSGGLLALPAYDWPVIFTTNYDTLVEQAYSASGVPLSVIRSNFDFAAQDDEDATLFKIHGCITQDRVDGHRTAMVLTETDLEDQADYRQALLQRLSVEMNSKDIIFIGYSLADDYLRREVLMAAKMHREQYSPKRLTVLSYERDEDRAQLLEQRGVDVAFGSLDDFVDALTTASPPVPRIAFTSDDNPLPPVLLSATGDANLQRAHDSDVHRLFNGGPASFADIEAGFTFERSVEPMLLRELRDPSTVAIALLGTGGVGKTTLARRLGHQLLEEGFGVWEHRSTFTLQPGAWLGVESRLRDAGRRAVLIVDDCTHHLREVNRIIDELGKEDEVALSLILTSTLAHWRPRTKSPHLFARGKVELLSRLTSQDIRHLDALTARTPQIRDLVDIGFASLGQGDRLARLRRRCRADMFVCLKNIFATESIDSILLQEYAELPEHLQDIYRLVAAIESTGAQVHRQLVMRMTALDSDDIGSLLHTLEGIVDEFDIRPHDGVFGWSTRHPVIAETITQYKFADQERRLELLRRLVEELNPTIQIEQRALRLICDHDFGIGSLEDINDQVSLLYRIVQRVPGDRVLRHRLIRGLMRADRLDAADNALKAAIDEVGMDPPLAGYSVRLLAQKARSTPGILDEDRVAMLYEARRLCIRNIERYPSDKHTYFNYGDIGSSFLEMTGDSAVLSDAVERMIAAEDVILDPELTRRRSELEAALRRSR